MANNCLINKLIASVDNDNLLKLGEMRVVIGTSDVKLMSRIAQTVSVVSGGTFSGGSTTVSLSSNSLATVLATAANTVISIPNKYSLCLLKGMTDTKVDLDVLDTANKLYDLEVESAHGNIKNLNGMNSDHSAGFTSLKIYNVKDVYGDMSGMCELYNASDIFLVGTSTNQGKMTGVISGSNPMAKLKIAWPGQSVAGDVNSFSSNSRIELFWVQGCDFGGTITASTFTNMSSLKNITLNDLPNLSGNINNVTFPSSVKSVYIVNTACSGSRAFIAANNPHVTTWGLAGDGFTD